MISDLQVRQRMKLIMSSSGIPDTKANRQKLMPQIQNMLVDEALKLQAAEQEEISVTPEEIEGGIASIFRQHNLNRSCNHRVFRVVHWKIRSKAKSLGVNMCRRNCVRK
jgi:hypothetical protein